METLLPGGIYPTVITPYDAAGRVDLDAYRLMVERYARCGCNGLFAACQSSESFFLSLEERESLAKASRRFVDETARENGQRPMGLVVSGHVADRIALQAEEIRRMADAGADAVILVTNRLDRENTSDEAWIADGERLLAQIPSDIALGLYEMPYPYKRLLTPAMIDWCIGTGRFVFLKDTCCDEAEIERRLGQMKGSGLRLLNANAQTLLASLRAGASGYCGIMANFHPRLYARLWRIWQEKLEEAERLHAMLSMMAFTESLCYPVTAKYHMALEGISMELSCRSRDTSQFSEYDRLCVRQMKQLSDFIEQNEL